jgi:hypothetical protein
MDTTSNSPKRGRRRYSRYKDLKEQGIVNSREHLDDLIKHHGFDPGYKFSHKCRVWDDEKTAAWIESKRVA